VLLSWDDTAPGFTDFHTETFSEYADLLTSGLVWQERRGFRARGRSAGRSQMAIDAAPGYHARLADCAEEAARRFLGRLGLDASDIDLLVPAPSGPEFADRLRARLGVPGDRVAYVAEDLEAAYTTGPIAAWQTAAMSGRLAEARTILLLAAGAGITVTLALYRQEPPESAPT
jgi:3-oxoacyl-[acyl-carrier-protein] synthase III